MVLTMLPMTALAAGSPVDLTGSQTVTGEHKDGTYYRVTGDTALTLNSAVIEPGDDANAPAIEVLRGKLTLTLVGESTVRGGRGYAGIYVAPGAELVITGSGKLNAFGGGYAKYDGLYHAAGAGIGGNGCFAAGMDQKITSQNFGKITILSGVIIATGGQSEQINYGSGSGIGAGGGSSMWTLDPIFSGEIVIQGGEVTANGGRGELANSYTGGGAGIGSGGGTGNLWEP